MFFKKDKTELERKLDMGAFGQVPQDVTLYLMLFLDTRSLIKLAMTNSSFYTMAHTLPKQIRVRVHNQEFKGTLTEFYAQYADYLHQKQPRDEEIEKIKVSRRSLKNQKDALRDWTTTNSRSKHFNCITDEEKVVVGGGCIVCTIGGVLVSFFTPIPCLLSTFLGAAAGGAAPLVACRTTKCICGVCLACKEARVDERENNLDSNFPPAQLAMRP